MPIYSAAKCDVLESMTSPGFEFARAIAHDEGIDLGLALMGVEADDPPAVILLEMPPGHVLQRHTHAAHRVEIVIRGSVVLPDGSSLGPGDVAVSDPMEFYGPLTAGSDGSLTVEIFGSAGGLVPHPEESTPHGDAVAARVRGSLGADG